MRFDNKIPDITFRIKLQKTDEVYECIQEGRRSLDFTTLIHVYDGKVWSEYTAFQKEYYPQVRLPDWRDQSYDVAILWSKQSTSYSPYPN
jgi:hypothetical protein